MSNGRVEPPNSSASAIDPEGSAALGDGAVVDREFRTTDVLIVLPVEAIKKPISSTSLWAGARRSSQSP